MKVLLHTRTPKELDWSSKAINLYRLPREGDYVSADGAWHRVRMIVHLVEGSEHEAEVYCERISHIAARREIWATSADKPAGDSPATTPTPASRQEASPTPVLLELSEAAKLARVSVSTLRHLIATNRLEAVNYGSEKRRDWRVTPEALAKVKSPPVSKPVEPPPAFPPFKRRTSSSAKRVEIW